MEDGRQVPAYRIANTLHSEIAQSLPLPQLPVEFGSAAQETWLINDEHARRGDAILSKAEKIAELLNATDVSYLTIKDQAPPPVDLQLGRLAQAVLAISSNVFDCNASPGTQEPGAEHLPLPETGPTTTTTNGAGTAAQSARIEVPVSSKKARLKRKRQQENRISEKKDAYEIQITHRLLELLNEFLDPQGNPHGEEEGPLLSLQDIKTLSEEIGVLRSKSVLDKVPVDQLTKLLELFDRHVRQAHLKEIDDHDDMDSENFEIVMTALESVQSTLMIMSSPRMPKQIYKEELIDRLIEFTRYQIVHSVFTAYDPLYRQLHKPPGEDEEVGEEEEEESGRKARRKSKTSRKRSFASKVSNAAVTNAMHKLCSVLGLLKDLLSAQRLLDSTILQLMKTVLEVFGVENIELLQLKAIGVACAVFNLYTQHQMVILDDVISMLWKQPFSKRSLRTYSLPDDDSKQIQMITGLLLHLVQCSVSLPDVTPDDESAPDKCLEPAINVCNYFWRNVLQRWAMPKTQDATDVKAIVENVLVDLLSTLNTPEFPAASLLLQVLCALLLGPAGVKSKDVTVRVNAIELLGQIATNLKRDAVKCGDEKLWMLQELQNPSQRDNSATDACSACNSSKGGKFTICCDGCRRCFHGDCMGVNGQDLLGRGWLCYCCICKKQLASYGSSEDKDSNPAKVRNGFKVPKGGAAIVQQILLNFLFELGTGDNLSQYARRFYVVSWYRYDPQGAVSLPFYRWRYQCGLPGHDFGVAPITVMRDVVIRVTRALGQQRPLVRGFDRILERLLATLQENASNPRAKALKAVSGIVEVDPGVLADDRVQKAVEGRFLDSAISVREAAMELVGRHIVSRPDVAIKYFDRLSERIMDTGVSVRKRVIRIIRDFCLSKADFPKVTEACVRVIARINDEEASIQDLVCKTFYEMWFEETSGQQTQFVSEGSVVPLDVAQRTEQLVNVLKRLQTHQSLVIIIKRSLALDFVPQNTKTAAPSMVSQAAVRNRCELMCTYLMDCILKAEEASEEPEAQALPYVSALYAFCLVDPTLCAPSSDPSRFAVTLQPYLKTQNDNRETASLLQNIADVIDTVLPLLKRPAQSFVDELERDLRQLIMRYSFLHVVHACIKCLASLTKLSRGCTLFPSLVRYFYKILDSGLQEGENTHEKASILRSLFGLGLFVRYGADLIDNMDDGEVSMSRILDLYKHYLRSEDEEIKVRALRAVGFVFLARPQYMLEEDIKRLTVRSLTSNTAAKMHMLRFFFDYLLESEKKMGCDDSSEDKRDPFNPVPIAAGAGDNNICGGVIQFHWELILARCLDTDDRVRQAALQVVDAVLRQGLVHPLTCVPHLIALEVDQVDANAKLAHRLLSHMNEKHPSFFESRLGDGLQMSFLFIQSRVANKSNNTVAAVAKGGISRIYKLIRGNRNSRNKFISSVVRKFDYVASGHAEVPFLLYCTEILTSLPFTLVDEALYLIFAINRVLQIRAGDLEASLKAELLKEPFSSYVKEFKMNEEPDTIDVPEDVLIRLRQHSDAAVSLSLLLKMKRHLKVSYSLDDTRCQAFQPSEPPKPGEVLSRQNAKEFDCVDIHLEQFPNLSCIVQRYQVFKSLLREDTMDFASYAPVPSGKKRSRPSMGQADGLYQGHGHAGSKMRRKSAPAAAEGGSDGNDGDGDGDEDYGGGTLIKRRKSSSSSANKIRNKRLLSVA